MSVIVAVHGVGYQFEGPNSIHAAWLPKLRDGLDRVGFRLPSECDLVCPFYGDLFRAHGIKAPIADYNAGDIEPGLEQELLAEWWSQVKPEPATKGAPGWLQAALYALTEAPFFSTFTDRLLIADLKQASKYLIDAELRENIRARVEACVTKDTRVIIGHSLGSVVAYETLLRHPEWTDIRLLLTLGSPLGTPLFKQRMGLAGAWPGYVPRWVNLLDKGDVVVGGRRLSELFGLRVEDALIDNGSKAHDATRYLTTREAGEAIAAALGEA